MTRPLTRRFERLGRTDGAGRSLSRYTRSCGQALERVNAAGLIRLYVGLGDVRAAVERQVFLRGTRVPPSPSSREDHP